MSRHETCGADIRNGEAAATVGALATPALLLDRDRLDRNLARLSSRMAARGVVLRPHMKTAKSIDVARRACRFGPGPITVSTLAEAAYFAEHGFRDMTYAVGLSPHAAERAMRLRKAGIDLKVLLDSPEQAMMLGAAGRAAGKREFLTPSSADQRASRSRCPASNRDSIALEQRVSLKRSKIRTSCEVPDDFSTLYRARDAMKG